MAAHGRMPSEGLVKLKLDENGHAVLQDGHPVYIHDDGKEAPFDAAAAAAAIRTRNAEAKQHRERAEAAESALKAFEGIDPAEAGKALKVVASLDAKKLVDAGDAEKAMQKALEPLKKQLQEVETAKQSLEQQLYGEIVGGAFARSKFIGERMVLPPDLAQAAFGKHFKVEAGKLVAVDAEGSPIYSRSNPGKPAEFDEALESLVSAYPNRDAILRPTQGSGSGAPAGGAASGSGGTPNLTQQALAMKGRG